MEEEKKYSLGLVLALAGGGVILGAALGRMLGLRLCAALAVSDYVTLAPMVSETQYRNLMKALPGNAFTGAVQNWDPHQWASFKLFQHSYLDNNLDTSDKRFAKAQTDLNIAIASQDAARNNQKRN